MYVFTYAVDTLIINGTGNMGPVHGNFPLEQFIPESGDSLGMSPTVFLLQNPSAGRVAFKADISEIDPGLAPGFTVADILANITTATAPPTPSPTNYSVTVGDGASLVYGATHGLGTKDLLHALRDVATNETSAVYQLSFPTVNTWQLTFTVAPALNSLRLTLGLG